MIHEVDDNRFLFHFCYDEDHLRVLAMEPWSFNRILLILALTDGATPVLEIPLHTCSMSILGMTATMAKLIGNRFGTFLEVSTEYAGDCVG